MNRTHSDREIFAARWAGAWNQRDIESVLAFFHDDIVFTSPTALAITGAPVTRGKPALRAYWHAAIARIGTLRFSIDHILWDPVCSELAIIYTSDIDGNIKRVSENFTFDENGLIINAEVFHGIPGQTPPNKKAGR